MNDARAADIKKWQERLFEAFSYNGVLGGRYLGLATKIEPEVGKVFVEKYYGHRILTDSFLDFFGESIAKQVDFSNKNGWNQEHPYYTTCLMMFVTMFRSYRAAELAAVEGGYPLQAYIIQRSLKDQAFAMCAAVNQTETFARLFGWEGMGGTAWTEKQYGTVIKNRMKVEDKIVRTLIGKDSGLSAETQLQLMKWNRLFNWEAHRGLLTLFRMSSRILIEKKSDRVLGPVNDEVLETMYANRCTEIGWMILRLLPYIRRSEAPKDESWDKKWKILDDSFRMMTEGLGALGKKIAPAMIELIDSKFAFTPELYYSEMK